MYYVKRARLAIRIFQNKNRFFRRKRDFSLLSIARLLAKRATLQKMKHTYFDAEFQALSVSKKNSILEVYLDPVNPVLVRTIGKKGKFAIISVKYDFI